MSKPHISICIKCMRAASIKSTYGILYSDAQFNWLIDLIVLYVSWVYCRCRGQHQTQMRTIFFIDAKWTIIMFYLHMIVWYVKIACRLDSYKSLNTLKLYSEVSVSQLYIWRWDIQIVSLTFRFITVYKHK